jgi:hypothetical protein
MFDWNYSTLDEPFFDPFDSLLNGNFTQLTNNGGGSPQNGTYMFNVLAGDIFGFRVATVDNIGGRATATISNFKAPTPVPEPTSVISLLALGALGAGIKGLKRK